MVKKANYCRVIGFLKSKGVINTDQNERDRWIELLSSGTCPICNKIGFKKVLCHLALKHQVNTTELKDELLLARDYAFCDISTSEKQREIALSQGLGKKIKADGPIYKTKHDKITKLKFKIRSNKPEAVERSKKVLLNPEVRKKINQRRANCSEEIKKSQTERILKTAENFRLNNKEKVSENCKKASVIAKIKQFGTEEGYPDMYYAEIALDFVNALKTGKTRNIFARMSESKGINKGTMQHRVKKCIERGLLHWTGKSLYPSGELTDKAKQLLAKQKLIESQKEE